MAAAEYYHGSGGPVQQPPTQPPRPHSNSLPVKNEFNDSSTSHLPYPVSDAPPPYSAVPGESRPPPQLQQQWSAQNGNHGYSNNGYAPPHPPQMNAPYPASSYPPPPPHQSYGPSGPQSAYRPNEYSGPQQTQPFPERESQQHLRPAHGIYPRRHSANPPSKSSKHAHFAPTPTSSDDDLNRARSRSRSRDRPHYGSHRHHSHNQSHSHHHDHYTNESGKKKKKSTGVESFLGAGGGAIIGDAIFPGLGTLGGALLGGLGGHEYGKQRRSYSDTGRERPSRRERESSYLGDDGRWKK